MFRPTAADLISFVSLFLGFFSAILALNGNLIAASFMLIGAAVSDFLDGRVARKRRTSSEFGKQIDSLCDIVSFGVAPAIFLFTFINGYLGIITFLIVVTGVYRLARFNATFLDHFQGMPITLNGLIIPIIYFLGLIDFYIAILLSIILPILMVSEIKFPKI